MKSIGLFLMCFLLAGSVQAGSDKKYEEELAEIRRILDAQAKNLATAMNQVQEMVSEFQKITGQVDQGLHGNEQQNKLLGDNQRRLDVLEDKLGHLVTQLEEIKAAGFMPAAQAKDVAEFKNYQMAVSKLNGADYKGAIASLEGFITTTPKSRYVDSAQYWIGESYYSMRDFPKAISEFQKVIRDYPKSGKMAPALLKQGLAFFEMQSLEDSKAFLTKLITKYPTSAEAIKAKERLTEIEAIEQAKAVQAIEKKSSL